MEFVWGCYAVVFAWCAMSSEFGRHALPKGCTGRSESEEECGVRRALRVWASFLALAYLTASLGLYLQRVGAGYGACLLVIVDTGCALTNGPHGPTEHTGWDRTCGVIFGVREDSPWWVCRDEHVDQALSTYSAHLDPLQLYLTHSLRYPGEPLTQSTHPLFYTPRYTICYAPILLHTIVLDSSQCAELEANPAPTSYQPPSNQLPPPAP